ncbi:oxidoreductase [Auriculariales sp. MPI-PUGE-AT-0066]|nr:oxidoreductase [Auriculariales sp. MPI-PUGE-AT-0066]
MTTSFQLNDGTHIPRTAWGCGSAQFNTNVFELSQSALKAGLIHLDGAQAYGNEDSLGAGFKASGLPRSSVFITTKLRRIPPGEDVRTTVVRSLAKLGVEYVDLFLVHSPSNHRDDHNYGGEPGAALKSVWAQVQEIKREGLARSIGVSNFNKEDLEIILADSNVVPSVNQIEYHAYTLSETRETVDLCDRKGIRIAAYGALSPISRFPGGQVEHVLTQLKTQPKWANVTNGQILIRWCHAKGIIAITTSSKSERMSEIAATLGDAIPELDAEEVALIDAAGEGRAERVFWKREYASGTLKP